MPVSVEIDQKAIDKARKTLARYEAKPLQERAGRAMLQVTRMLVGPVKAGAPRRIGALQSSVKARATTQRGSKVIAGGLVGPTARHRHLVIQPHRIVTPGGRDTGRQTTGNPFVDAAVEPRIEEATRIVTEITFGAD